MTIEEVRDYAKGCRIPQKRIAELIAELHPDERGNLSLEESLAAIHAIRCAAHSRECTEAMLKAGKRARRSAGYTRVPTDEQTDGASLQAQKDAAAEYATENGMEPFVVDYRACYDLITDLQHDLAGQHHDAEIGCLDYKAVKALAATYELQDYLANRIAQAVADGELEPDPEE